MDEHTTDDKDYIRGFNEGYVIAEHMPQVSEQLKDALGDSSRSQGFKDGREQLTIDKRMERTPAWLRTDRYSEIGKNKEVPKGKERERGDIEPER